MTDQGTAEWLQERCGKVTASRIADLMARTKTGWGATRANYAAQLIAERLTGCVTPSFTNAAMIHGTETEPEARRAYEFYVDRDVQQVGFIPHPTIAMAGASPDGLVGTDGLVEIKYLKQMMFQMMCCGREWCDFASYDPRLPERMRLFVRRVTFDTELAAEIAETVTTFIAEIDDTVGKLLAKYEPQLEAA
jgi:hypothetical protein